MDARHAAIRLHLAELSPRARQQLVVESGGLEGLAGSARGPADALAAWRAVDARAIDEELARCAGRGIDVVTREHPRWPAGLDELPDPPRALWVRGALPDESLLPVAIVGPRRPSTYGIAMAQRLAKEIVDLGCLVISGGARGIDSLAHAAAVAAASPTVAVLGCGVDVAYPRGNAELFARIAEHGAVVSEHPCGTPPLPHHFPIRNRLLAGWSCAVAVVEADLHSGSLITARLGIEQGRDVLAVPGPVTSPLSAGTNELLARGARVLRHVGDLVGELRPDQKARLRPRPVAAASLHRDDVVLAALPCGQARSVDELAGTTGLSIGELMARLAIHETFGLVQSLPGGLWMRAGGA